ncbi:MULTISPECIES: chemotaxis protein CheC [unclassified Undibacterium]|uniref:chemotaxis protein CheC n=1 Tax=unclassified Undibacterium TaxID=2630295 RepID=UPI002AC8B93C|nr:MULTISPECIES: chemotaxis protein CheC [unclassified Undibacterium]MEB0140505.1 chemotaxis protein CheC [Undibacterium sp. CCC2.1]MEB0173518.1 chemotaxis protein CheC [Undibacterium sp. CCC1.1]MEB0177504.1 chemotaxis protein CheC [Undibacterium sp. CCC3.4]MEB0216630.1 chemotaxis protein CheC [Undibacterium sp. 5I2]WPX42347.1 chemotaxis protein CheC [Undibacterium sp. CCC3.4]
MIALSELHLDALSEVFNVGAGRAAASLSEIVGDEVKLSVPSVEVRKFSEVDNDVMGMKSERYGAVHQTFSGAFEAEAILLFTEDHALEIVRDMMGSQISIEDLAEFEQEAMCELGNIILNACLSAMADMLNIPLNCSLPDYGLATMEEIFRRVGHADDEAYLLLLHIDLAIEKRRSEGHLVFLLSSTSLQDLVTQIDRFLGEI